MLRESSKRELDNFLHNVAWLRMHHGLSKKKMANLLEISVGTLSKIESGELPLRLDVGIFSGLHITLVSHHRIFSGSAFKYVCLSPLVITDQHLFKKLRPGGLHRRDSDCRKTMSLRASAHTGVAISQ